MDLAEFNRRPIVIAIAGPNGAGKTTFFHSHLALAGLRFVCADVLAESRANPAASKNRFQNGCDP